MSNLFTLPSQRAIDSNTDALAGAKLYFYDPGTTDDRTVYSNRTLATAHAQPVVADAGGLFAPIYLPTGAYKVVLKDADDVTIFTADNVDGPLDTSTFLQDGDLVLDSPVVSKTTTYTVVAGDKGKIINANPTGGSFTITLLSAVTAGDGFPLTIRHVGTANQVTVEATTGQTIDGRVGISLTDQYQSITLTSDGANWHIVSDAPKFKETAPYFTVQDRLTAPPTSPTPGACYIINGTPTGAWASYAEKDLVIATGTGSWAKFTPATGWKAWIVDEDVESVFYDSAWTDYSNVTAPTTSALKIAVFSDEKSVTTNGGTPTATAWTKHDLQTERSNTITGASLASSVITLPTGKYMIHAQMSLYSTQVAQIRLRNTTDASTVAISPQMYGANYVSNGASIFSSPGLVAFGYVDVTEATENIELQYYVATAATTTGLGQARSVGSENEVYAVVTILDLTSIQGPTGSQGAQGNDGLDAAFDYQFNTATSGDPGAGKYLFDNATFASVTQFNISETTASGGDIAAEIATWDDSTSSVKAKVVIRKEGAPQNFQILSITGAGTDAGGYWTFPVTPIDSDGTISNGNDVSVLHVPKGDKGDTGLTGATGAAGVYSFDYTFDTGTTAADPGSGKIRANNATLSSATALYINETDRVAVSQAAAIAEWDDSTNDPAGYLTLIDLATPANRVRFKIDGSLTDNGSYDTIPVVYVSGVTSLTAVNIAILFERVGNKGADGNGGEVWFDASASPYSATGDGGTDDRAAIQDAIDDAAAAGGGTVYLPPGIYKITNGLVLYDSVELRGAGPGTIIRPQAGSMAGNTIATASVYASIAMVAVTGAAVRYLTLDHATNATDGNGIQIGAQAASTRSTRCAIEHCLILGTNTHQYELFIQCADYNIIAKNRIVGHSSIPGTDTAGIEIYGGVGNTVRDNDVSYCAPGLALVQENAYSNADNIDIKFVGNRVSSCTNGLNMVVTSSRIARNILIQGNTFKDCTNAGVSCGLSDTGEVRNLVIEGNAFYDNVLDIYVSSGSVATDTENVLIANNVCNDGGSGISVANITGAKINGNMVRNKTNVGMSLSVADRTEVQGNTIATIAGSAMAVYTCDLLTITGNSFLDLTGLAVQSADSGNTNWLITDNVMERTSGSSATSVVSATTADNVVCLRNTVRNPPTLLFDLQTGGFSDATANYSVAGAALDDLDLPAGEFIRFNGIPNPLCELSGITNGVDGRVIRIYNNTSGETLTLLGDDAGSTAENRLRIAAGSAAVTEYQTATLRYSKVDARWILVALTS